MPYFTIHKMLERTNLMKTYKRPTLINLHIFVTHIKISLYGISSKSFLKLFKVERTGAGDKTYYIRLRHIYTLIR